MLAALEVSKARQIPKMYIPGQSGRKSNSDQNDKGIYFAVLHDVGWRVRRTATEVCAGFTILKGSLSDGVAGSKYSIGFWI